MAESLDSRKFERKAVFDVPLPIRRAQRDTPTATEEVVEQDVQQPPNTMAFALMTKKGNRQQVCTSQPSRKLLSTWWDGCTPICSILTWCSRLDSDY